MSEPCDVSPPHGFVLCEYMPGYLDAMFRLDQTCFAAPFRFSRKALHRYAEARKAQVLLVLLGEELAAFCIAHVERSGAARVAYLLTLDVAPPLRCQGLGRLLLRCIEARALKAECHSMLLHVFLGNAEAISLYERLGYARVGSEQNFYGAGMHAWIYRKVFV